MRTKEDLKGTCGGCRYGTVVEDSPYKVRCTNGPHLTGNRFKEKPSAAVRYRTTKGCRYYKDKEE